MFMYYSAMDDEDEEAEEEWDESAFYFEANNYLGADD